ncbi:putative metal-dependent hydrolase [Priestia megaterium]|uniref:YfiT family bacillithiol transferase n=1 Tax=Priestia megaterium TaxID=1404 RepID=UPI0026E43660|nr:putative metal-dependent hydrolase [Priestia megaterium]MDO6851743.1 putative metal-dependent hydrolase [Priestia megaterium]
MFNQYPIGKFTVKENIQKDDVQGWISDIGDAPKQLAIAVEGLTKEQLATPYREGGWTLSQVVHHLADSHINSYIRFKVGLTEINPIIKTYDEVAWATLIDNDLPIEISLQLFSALHKRLHKLLCSLSERDLKRVVQHPENGQLTIEQLIATYAWHGKHHIAHITTLRNQKGW